MREKDEIPSSTSADGATPVPLFDLVDRDFYSI
jgi:hypothetical protein